MAGEEESVTKSTLKTRERTIGLTWACFFTPLTGKKLKRRLEDLERRAATTDGTPSGKDGSKSSQSGRTNKRQHQPVAKATKQAAPPPSKPVSQSQFTPPMHPEDDYLFRPVYDDRERSHTPPMLSYSTYPPPPEDILLPPYSTAPQSYRPMTTDAYADYLTPTVPVTLPSMTHFTDAVKREPSFPFEDSLTPYISYTGYVPGFDMNPGAPSPYDHSNPHVSSLRHPPLHSPAAALLPPASAKTLSPPRGIPGASRRTTSGKEVDRRR